MKRFSEHTTFIMCCLALLGVGFALTSMYNRQQMADQRREARCLHFDLPNHVALNKLLHGLEAHHPNEKAEFKAYFKATKDTLKAPCGDFKQAAESGFL